MLTPTEQASLDAAARRNWHIDAVVLALVAMVLRLPALFATRTLVFDDGTFGNSALAMRAGELPFRDVFSSQGPLFLPLVFVADLLGVRALNAPRLLAVAAGLLVTVATYSCARRLTTRGNALLAAGLVTTSGSVLWVTGPINADGPALALSVLAVAFALRYRDSPRTIDAVWVGLAGGAAISIKALSVPAVGIAGLVLLLSHRRVLDTVSAASIALGVYIVTALPWGIDRVWEQSFSYHRDAIRQESPMGTIGKIVTTLWDRDLPLLVALALAGAMLVVARVGRWRAGVPAGAAVPDVVVAGIVLWAALVFLILVWEPAMWRAHVAHLVPPLALLASLQPPPWRVLAIAAVVIAPVWALQNRTILWPGGYEGQKAALVTRLRSLPVDALVISDDPGLAWRAGHHAPPELVDPSFQRIDRGDITTGSVARAAADTDVCAVVETSRDHFGRLEGLPLRLGAVGYRPEPFGRHITLYARPGCDPS